jgi:hypothetical protein
MTPMFQALAAGSDRVALAFPDRSLSYRQLAAVASRIGAQLAGA